MATAAVDVELGFVKESAPWELQSKFFVSKVGGCPAWLHLNNLPDQSNMVCKTCLKPMIFLLQVYAPIREVESAFHRTIFLFMCPDGKCCKRFGNQNFVVFRNQLPRQNEFYSFEVPDYIEETSYNPSAENYQSLCCICSCVASIKCSKCSEADYCSEFHRDCDCSHQSVCGKNGIRVGAKQKRARNRFLLPEYELVTETEELPSMEPEKSDEEKMKEFRQFILSDKAPKEIQDIPIDYLDDIMKKNDKAFNKFLKRIKLEPEQVLRYQRGETPLWVSTEHVPSPKSIPDCVCGAKRVFEFQVMPQLLNYFSSDSIQDSVDWGTLIVYTCSVSCENGVDGYIQEFLWKQDFSGNQ